MPFTAIFGRLVANIDKDGCALNFRCSEVLIVAVMVTSLAGVLVPSPSVYALKMPANEMREGYHLQPSGMKQLKKQDKQ